MRMPDLCRCVAYGYAVHILFSYFSTADPKTFRVGNLKARLIEPWRECCRVFLQLRAVILLFIKSHNFSNRSSSSVDSS
ncbi:hypothetical protein FBF54_28060 (plasmid) [Klebsiella pneumoniae]|nr:hypothetical protein FBF55_09355 [Klebsiella pneumoniae]QHU76581.1 hypothetical protein FBF54_28060 [Klebsiella pneumoniae]